MIIRQEGAYVYQMYVNNKSKGSKIRQLREEMGLGRTEFGAKIGYTYQQMERVEDDLTPVTDDLLRKLSREYGISVAWLEGESENVSPHPGDSNEMRRARMRQVYEESGLTQREFGRQTHTATSMLGDVISGRKPLTIRYARKIEESLDVGMDWLLYGDERAKEDPCDEAMLTFIKTHPDIRKEIREKMKAEQEGKQADEQ